ncbi:MAG: glycosyltransferase, partial [Aestuariivirga sp.]
WTTLSGAAFLGAEWLLARLGSGLHFVCDYERDSFAAKIGIGRLPHAVVHNGLWPEEFTMIATEPDAADVVFIGDMRRLKGVDVLIEALALCNRTRRTTALLVGDGPDMEMFKRQANTLGLDGLVTFPGRMTAGQAFRLGRLLVLPSRAESFPYVVLEACAAGKPLIASDAGGISEILEKLHLVPPGDAGLLVGRISSVLANPAGMAERALAIRDSVRRKFSAEAMVSGVVALYRQVQPN